MYWSYIACFVAIVFPLPHASGAELDAASVLESFRVATAAVNYYDVIVESKDTATAQAVQTGTALQGGRTVPVIKWKPLSADATPAVTVYRSRQVYSSDGRRRFERLAGTNQDVTIVFTGDTTREYSKKTNTGIIVSRGPEQRPFPLGCENYSSLFHRVYLGGDLVALFRERSRIVARHDPTDGDLIVLETDAQEDAKMYPARAFRLVLDPKRGMMPARIEVFKPGFRTRLYSFETSQFHQIGNGAWVPVEARILEGSDELVKHVAHLTVDVPNSSWNRVPDDALFKLSFPSGTHVIDEVTSTAFVAGRGDPGTTVDELLENAGKSLVPGRQGELTSESSSVLRTVLLVVNGIAFVAVILVIAFKALGRRKSMS